MYFLDTILVIILDYLDENLSYNCHFRWCVCEEIRVLYLGQWGVGCTAGSGDVQSAGVPRDGQCGRSHDRSSSNMQQSQSSLNIQSNSSSNKESKSSKHATESNSSSNHHQTQRVQMASSNTQHRQS